MWSYPLSAHEVRSVRYVRRTLESDHDLSSCGFQDMHIGDRLSLQKMYGLPWYMQNCRESRRMMKVKSSGELRKRPRDCIDIDAR